MSGWCASGIPLTHIALSLSFSISLIGVYQLLMAFEGLYQPSTLFSAFHSTSILIVAGFTPGAVTVSVASPLSVPARNMAVAAPLNNFILGW